MVRLRGLVRVVVLLIAVFLVSCGGPPPVAKVPTYTPAQLERVQAYAESIVAQAKRFEDLPAAIKAKDYQEVQAIARGPLGQMLQDMRNLNRNLLVKDQKPATEVTRELFDDLLKIQQETQGGYVNDALQAYATARKDFDRYLQSIPQAS